MPAHTPHGQGSDCRMNGSGSTPRRGNLTDAPIRGGPTGMTKRSARRYRTHHATGDGRESPSQGRGSPFGVEDLVGNIWQWTDEYLDDHTRAGILRGGSHYQPQGSHWYFPQAYRLDEHGKFLLIAPSKDRSAAIGFPLRHGCDANGTIGKRLRRKTKSQLNGLRDTRTQRLVSRIRGTGQVRGHLTPVEDPFACAGLWNALELQFCYME